MSKILECSTAGDDRFSAFKAHVLFHGEYDTIENFYQNCKRDENNKIPGKGKPVHHVYWYGKTYPAEALSVIYGELWRLYFKQRPYLLDYAKGFDKFTDRFKGKAINCQADVIAKLVKEMKGTDREYKDIHINSLWAVDDNDLEKYTYVVKIPKFRTLSDCLTQLAKILKFIKRGGKAVSYKGVELNRKNVLWMAKLYYDTVSGLGEQGILSATKEEDLWDYKLFYTKIDYSYDIREYDDTYFSAGVVGVEEAHRSYLQPDLDFTITIGVIPELIDVFRKPRKYTDNFTGEEKYESLVKQYKSFRFVDLTGSIKDGYSLNNKRNIVDRTAYLNKKYAMSRGAVNLKKELLERVFGYVVTDESANQIASVLCYFYKHFEESILITTANQMLANADLLIGEYAYRLVWYVLDLISDGKLGYEDDVALFYDNGSDDDGYIDITDDGEESEDEESENEEDEEESE